MILYNSKGEAVDPTTIEGIILMTKRREYEEVINPCSKLRPLVYPILFDDSGKILDPTTLEGSQLLQKRNLTSQLFCVINK